MTYESAALSAAIVGPFLLMGLLLAYDTLAAHWHEPLFNVSTRRVGGLRFIWIGRFVISFCVRRPR